MLYRVAVRLEDVLFDIFELWTQSKADEDQVYIAETALEITPMLPKGHLPILDVAAPCWSTRQLRSCGVDAQGCNSIAARLWRMYSALKTPRSSPRFKHGRRI
jgi:hypothetical protein